MNTLCNEEWSIIRRVEYLSQRVLCTKKDKNMLCKMGQRLARAHLKKRGYAPLKQSQLVDGVVRDVNHYTLQDFVEFGDAVLAEVLASYDPQQDDARRRRKNYKDTIFKTTTWSS